ncbi:hypothetical protein SBA1_780001 [Candidatus Sulfotelmatobacter kueseliae]|uniref:Uncharacterized protein n=1 Tax=Candidatus Sulfotelmatobacter kueseliae TaxID=2042962 RepID=A0A2U3L7A9_9BACT|nr:hypothetical protein SBA1_780001 [Candidatus Sulfotelmatobacter kueseliae]
MQIGNRTTNVRHEEVKIPTLSLQKTQGQGWGTRARKWGTRRPASPGSMCKGDPSLRLKNGSARDDAS